MLFSKTKTTQNMHARIPLYEKRGKSDGRRNERGELFGTKRMTNSFLQNKILFNVYYPKLGFQTKGGIVWSTRFTPEVITCFFYLHVTIQSWPSFRLCNFRKGFKMSTQYISWSSLQNLMANTFLLEHPVHEEKH